jgi:hypothetical protein
VTQTDRVTVCNVAIEERQGGIHEYSKGLDEEVSFPCGTDMVYGLRNTGTRRDFVAIRYVKGNSGRSTSVGPGRGLELVGGRARG